MSFNKLAISVLASYRRVHISRRISVSSTNKLLQQTINRPTLRILQPCCRKLTGVRPFSTSIINRGKKLDGSFRESNPESAEHIEQTTMNSTLQSQKLRSWSFTVGSFDCIKIKTCFDVIVKPASPLEYPTADRAFVTLSLRSNKKVIDDDLLERVITTIEAQAVYSDSQLQLEGIIPYDSELDELMEKYNMSIAWQVEVPISFDADIHTSGRGNILLESLENHNCTVQSEHGNCYINKIKSGNIKVSSLSGDVISKKVLQGNAEITTQASGTITADRLQGQTFLLRSEAGSIRCKDIYAVESVLNTTCGGGVELCNVHADCSVTTSAEGNVQIDTLEGSLKAITDAGDITAYLVRHKEAKLSSQHGNISVKVPIDVASKVHLQAPSVIIAPELESAGIVEERLSDKSIMCTGEWNRGTDSSLQARTEEGSITVAVQSWFDSLKLNR